MSQKKFRNYTDSRGSKPLVVYEDTETIRERKRLALRPMGRNRAMSHETQLLHGVTPHAPSLAPTRALAGPRLAPHTLSVRTLVCGTPRLQLPNTGTGFRWRVCPQQASIEPQA
ncbi:unnamed protein product [Pipistrellus nathusii]|uniref:Uncharacterized protein n=1 Tax=Pipistrellus nathusii TaxID=59473 RepID=A0ABP0AGJ0_PIPNA